MNHIAKIKELIHQAKEKLSPDFLIVILGPTASGKTKLAVELARQIDGEIISADSRQVYRDMDIGTGKDLEEYRDVPYHLINIKNPGDKYNVDLFRVDFFQTYDYIISRKKSPILCGGSGSYIQTVLQERPYTQIPKNEYIQHQLRFLSKEELLAQIHEIGIPKDLKIDFNSHKRLVRALEILLYLKHHSETLQPQRVIPDYIVFGINPPLEERRSAITRRLEERLQKGLVEEVERLIAMDLNYDDLIYYGLEYKYVALYLRGSLTYDQMAEKLNTEIHRYAKRQMTYFRKMERDGIKIHWL
ncbi:tRNA (adenosine(37)-N6)-dimethylallyltransferase MiaA [Sphingobacterium chuzhouense]|uniref:tRNA (adenosine(37)-N6)-dimethylallyltransferase MiaA n=1 Tax=Sphingobacterium chuzhouense TaxID=1742264 RepID=UPI00293BDB0A|nr:tRNA (adenosine(37)-N6)-dimethylallyltransferase MiaA [Sphingobacterium chuzhouense]